jgi:hypothetical protein
MKTADGLDVAALATPDQEPAGNLKNESDESAVATPKTHSTVLRMTGECFSV